MIDSMHQSWLPRVVAAAFPGEGGPEPFALLQRRQPQVVTAARYRPRARPPVLSLRPTPPLWGSGGWLARPRLLSQPRPPSQHLLSPDATAEAALLSHPDPEPREAAAARPLPAPALLHGAGRQGPQRCRRGLRREVHLPHGAHGEQGARGGPRGGHRPRARPIPCCPHSTTTCPAACAPSLWWFCT